MRGGAAVDREGISGRRDGARRSELRAELTTELRRPERTKRLDRWLRPGLLATVLIGVAILVVGTIAASGAAPPIPDRAMAPDGTVIYSGADVIAGKAIFQRADLMDFGSLYGNGAYYGPDWGADYLHREALQVQDLQAHRLFGAGFDSLTAAQRSTVSAAVVAELRANRYGNGVLTLTADEVAAAQVLQTHYRQLFIAGDSTLGLAANTVRNTAEADQLTAFFEWTAWTSVAQRPGESYSYTNNWPYELLVGNTATDSMRAWTWGSLALLVVGAALAVWFYRRFIAVPVEQVDATPAATALAPTRSQRSLWIWFLAVPLLLLAQGAMGVLLAHFYADRSGFFGLDVTAWVPYQVWKAWHLQLAIAWIAAAWMAAGIFLAPLVARREPRGQHVLTWVLLVAVVAVVVGASVGMWLGVKVDLGGAWFWFGNQGLEYVQLGRFFQIALVAGLLVWAVIIGRAMWPAIAARRRWGSLEALLLYSGVAIGAVYLFGMQPMTGIMDSATMTDYWRWWVVHLWVENVFEFFTVAVVGYALLSMGLLSRRMVERVVYVELILVLGAGIVGMGHHFYFAGEPAVWLGLGAMFSALEVVPLGLMLWRAWTDHRRVHAAGRAFPQRVAFRFFTSAAVWNVLGAGVLGLAVNPPLWNYYEHGEFLTLAHAHASLMGAFGMLALGLVYFALRGTSAGVAWSDRLGTWAMWLFNGAIALWLALNLLPIGIGQLLAALQHGYFYARSVDFYNGWTALQWLRLPGDVLFIAGGLVMLLDVVLTLRRRLALRQPRHAERLAA